MSRFFNETFACTHDDCGAVFEKLILRGDRGREVPCSRCGRVARKTVAAPTVLEASWPDGKVRPGMRRLAEAAELESEAYNLPLNKRGELMDEVKKLKSTKIRD